MNKRDECLSIYREAFSEEDTSFEAALFEKCFDECIIKTVGNQVAAMFFALECEIITESSALSAIYIYAAATRKAFRSKGYMTKLLENFKKECGSVIFLRPANEKLIDFYQSCGFQTIKAKNSNLNLPVVKPLNSFAELTHNIKSGNGEEFTLMYYSNKKINIDNLNFIYSME